MITCRARGNFRNDNITPLVGDDVKIQMSDNNTGYVVEILERKNELLRPKVSNIDYSIIIVSVKEPDFSSKLLNKLICLFENRMKKAAPTAILGIKYGRNAILFT